MGWGWGKSGSELSRIERKKESSREDGRHGQRAAVAKADASEGGAIEVAAVELALVEEEAAVVAVAGAALVGSRVTALLLPPATATATATATGR